LQNEDEIQSQEDKILNDILERSNKNKIPKDVIEENIGYVTDIIEDFKSLFNSISTKKYPDDEDRQKLYFNDNIYGNIAPRHIYLEEDLNFGEVKKDYDNHFIPVDYKFESSSLQSSAEDYIKNPGIQHNFLDFLYIYVTCYLYAQEIKNIVGFKLMFPHVGWRYNFWRYFLGNYFASAFLGLITSGFVIFPIIIYLFSTVDKLVEYVAIPIIFSVLLLIKILLSIYFLITGIFKKKDKIKTNFLKLIEVLDYMGNNVIQPQKLKTIIEEIDYLPPYINIIISRMINTNPDLFDNNRNQFINLYQR